MDILYTQVPYVHLASEEEHIFRSLWDGPVICVTRMEIVSVRKFEGAMKAKRKVLSNLNNCSPEQKSVAKKAKRILFFILN